MPRSSAGDQFVVGAEVQPRLDREDHARLEHGVEVHLARGPARSRARRCRGGGSCRAPSSGGGTGPPSVERLLDRAPGTSPHSTSRAAMTCIAASLQLAERAPRPRHLERGVRRLEHGLVDPALRVAEPPGHRQRAGDVGGVQAVHLDAGVDEDEVAVAHLAVVADPVQRAGVRPRRPRSCRSRRRCPRAGPGPRTPSRRRARRASCATASARARTMSSKPRAVTSTASRSCSISHSSLTSRSSLTARASSASRLRGSSSAAQLRGPRRRRPSTPRVGPPHDPDDDAALADVLARARR